MQDVRFVLVRTASGGNVGASARALANTGFASPWLVAPDDWNTEEAARLAHGAEDVLAGARRCATLQDAVADCRWIVGTSRRAGRRRTAPLAPRAFARTVWAQAERRPLAIVFGPEADGLSTAELAVCQDIVHIPAAAAQPSYNLAQAVLLIAYELFSAGLESVDAGRDAERAEANGAALEAMYAHLEKMLLGIGFVRADSAPAKMLAVRKILGRARLRPDDVRLLRGICRQALWAAAGPDAPVRPGRPHARQPRGRKPAARGNARRPTV